MPLPEPRGVDPSALPPPQNRDGIALDCAMDGFPLSFCYRITTL